MSRKWNEKDIRNIFNIKKQNTNVIKNNIFKNQVKNEIKYKGRQKWIKYIGYIYQIYI